jgi:hypothetical protein
MIVSPGIFLEDIRSSTQFDVILKDARKSLKKRRGKTGGILLFCKTHCHELMIHRYA